MYQIDVLKKKTRVDEIEVDAMGVDKVGVDEMGRIRTGITSSETVTPKSWILMTRLKFERVCKCNN